MLASPLVGAGGATGGGRLAGDAYRRTYCTLRYREAMLMSDVISTAAL